MREKREGREEEGETELSRHSNNHFPGIFDDLLGGADPGSDGGVLQVSIINC